MAVTDPNAPDTVDGLNPEFKIIYNLPEEESVQTDTAFKFIDTNNNATKTFIKSDDVGPNKINGYDICYIPWISNQSDRFLKLEYIGLPDRRMKCLMSGLSKFAPGLMGAMELAADSAVRIMGYPIRLTYTDDEGNRYNQVLRVNLYPTRREAADSAIAHRAPGVPYHPQPGL